MWGAEPLPHIDASNDLMLGAALDIRSVMPASSNKFVARASSKEEFVPIVLKRSVPAGYIIQADDLERRRVNSYLATQVPWREWSLINRSPQARPSTNHTWRRSLRRQRAVP